jgi:hypothetical protein
MEAEAILRDAVSAYRAALGERSVAAYALGSLAHGGFAPLVSDIDLGLIIADPLQPDDAETVRSVADAAKASVRSSLSACRCSGARRRHCAAGEKVVASRRWIGSI